MSATSRRVRRVKSVVYLMFSHLCSPISLVGLCALVILALFLAKTPSADHARSGSIAACVWSASEALGSDLAAVARDHQEETLKESDKNHGVSSSSGDSSGTPSHDNNESSVNQAYQNEAGELYPAPVIVSAGQCDCRRFVLDRPFRLSLDDVSTTRCMDGCSIPGDYNQQMDESAPKQDAQKIDKHQEDENFCDAEPA